MKQTELPQCITIMHVVNGYLSTEGFELVTKWNSRLKIYLGAISSHIHCLLLVFFVFQRKYCLSPPPPPPMVGSTQGKKGLKT